MKRLGWVSRAGLAVGVVASLAACRGATEILLDIHTNVPCTGKATWQGVAVYTGEPGLGVETTSPSTTTTTCSTSGEIGTLAVVPTGSTSAVVGIRVVAGITRAPETCADNGYEGCIVTRRTVSFLPHQAINLAIDLDSACEGQSCDSLTSCVDGQCVDARITQSTVPDAGEAGAGVSGPVRCGDDGVTCPTSGELCCLQPLDGGTRGQCMDPKQCPVTDIVLACDTSSQCVQSSDAGEPIVCCMNTEPNYTNDNAVVVNGQCLPQTHCLQPFELGDGKAFEFCQDRAACFGYACQPANSLTGDSPLLPGYWYCQTAF
jgi:hypothetical protein